MSRLDLFAPYRLGVMVLANRFVMAPMTRLRADGNGVPTHLAVDYYAQRAGAGLIITEGTQPSATGQVAPNAPGLHTDEQVAGWRAVADAVHARGGHLLVQLMHAGRISHSMTIGTRPVSPSAVRPAGQAATRDGWVDFERPRALDADELPGLVAEHVDAACRAVAAGLDGVELHAANGWLLQQFLAEGTNRRTDAYGGSPENRARFVVEVAGAVAEAIGPQRVGIRISPAHSYNDIAEIDTAGTYTALLAGIQRLNLLYLHVLEEPSSAFRSRLRRQWDGVLIANTGDTGRSDLATARSLVESGEADLFSVGRGFLANPDLVERLRSGAALTAPDRETFYGGGARGYTDYPIMNG
jgi:N-ethylmaleimide reductase